MGRLLLIGFIAALVGACGDDASRASAAAAHSDLACAACHQGPRGERGRATVPEASCTGSGCHEQGGPEEVQVTTVTFPHRGHGATGTTPPTCAGCHTHETGDAPLRASVDACALCHVSEVTTGGAQECTLCHTDSEHAEATNQGVVVAHSELPWLDIGCVRCHYDVASARAEVSGMSCRQCHDDMAILNDAAVGRDLHPIHSGVTCTSCHEEDLHEVRAMSSVVELVCSDCHTQEHGVRVDGEGRGAGDLCATCHGGVHSGQQRLVLGIRPDSGVTPSAKFLAGITCRSCHVPPEAAVGDRPIRGRAESCSACHPPEYEQVLDWWQEGLRTRIAMVDGYADRGEREAGRTSDSAGALVTDAREMIGLVRQAGGQHNLELSDRLLRDAVDRVRQAYEAAGRQPPPSPNLGRAPHVGLCSYCHYESTQSLDIRDMPEDFHRTLLGRPD